MRPTSTMPTNGAGSTRGLASRRGHGELKRFLVSLTYDTHQTRLCQLSSRSFWQVWQDALDLTQSGGTGEVKCLFHYTTRLGFRNITAPSKKAVEVFVLHSVTTHHVVCLPPTHLRQPINVWRSQGFPCDGRSKAQCMVGTRQVQQLAPTHYHKGQGMVELVRVPFATMEPKFIFTF